MAGATAAITVLFSFIKFITGINSTLSKILPPLQLSTHIPQLMQISLLMYVVLLVVSYFIALKGQAASHVNLSSLLFIQFTPEHSSFSTIRLFTEYIVIAFFRL